MIYTLAFTMAIGLKKARKFSGSGFDKEPLASDPTKL